MKQFGLRRWALLLAGGVVLLIFLIGLVQAAAKNRSNPPAVAEPQWDSPETRQLAERACFDCHSNQTKWPWYSGLPVISRLISDHVDKGRSRLNFSEWGSGRNQEVDEVAQKAFDPAHYARDDAFPQPPYSLLHPQARLNQQERERLSQGLITTMGSGH